MRLKRRRQYPDLGDHAIFGDEEAAELRAQLADVVSRVEELNERVNAQFTSISAHAEISREQMSEVREEARADMERSREMLLGLIDRLRDESHAEDADRADEPAAESPSRNARLDGIQRQVAELADALERCERRQRHIAETMTEFIDTMMNQPQQHEPHDERPVRLVLA